MAVIVTSRHDLTVVLRFVAAIVAVVHRMVLRLRNARTLQISKSDMLKIDKTLKLSNKLIIISIKLIPLRQKEVEEEHSKHLLRLFFVSSYKLIIHRKKKTTRRRRRRWSSRRPSAAATWGIGRWSWGWWRV